MRVYFKLKDTKEPLYTAYAVNRVKDKQTGKIYYPGEMIVRKKDQAPQKLVDYDDRYELDIRKEAFHMERRGLFGRRKVITQLSGSVTQKEYVGMKGFWVIEGYNPPLYTAKACDLFRDKATKQEYRRGEMQIYWTEDYPFPLAEHLNKFDFIYFEQDRPMTRDDYAREIWAGSLCRR